MTDDDVAAHEAPRWLKVLVPVVGIALVGLIGLALWVRLAGGADLEAHHRAFLDSYVDGLQRGDDLQPSADADASLAHLARAASWRVQGVELGVGTDGHGDTCWTIDTVSSTGEHVGIVIGVSDHDGPIRIAGWGLQSRCRCPGRTASGSLRC